MAATRSLLSSLSNEEPKLAGEDSAKADMSPRPSIVMLMSNSVLGKEVSKAVRFTNSNKIFWNHAFLAFSVAMWMTLFGLPVYSIDVRDYIFGVSRGSADPLSCGPKDVGYVSKSIPRTGEVGEPKLTSHNRTHSDEVHSELVWCGFLPGCYFDAWPAVVQTCLFTVYRNTGTTIKQACQCLMGIGCAILNRLFLTLFFPGGAKDPHYIEWVVWIDFSLFLFVFLASRVEASTRRMVCCWHVCLMLHFMNPNIGNRSGSFQSAIPGMTWDSETTVVMFTSVMGCTIAVLATFIPRSWLNITHVRDDAMEIVKGVDVVFTEAIDCYCRPHHTPQIVQVAAKMNALCSMIDRVGRNLEDSYWETFDLGSYKDVRKLFGTFNAAMKESQEDVYLVKVALQELNFDDDHHVDFAEGLGGTLHALKTETIECIKVCAACCEDGVISAIERSQIEEHVQRIQDRQLELSRKYRDVMRRNKAYISEAGAADRLFVFSISEWSRELQDWAADLSELDMDDLGSPATGEPNWSLLSDESGQPSSRSVSSPENLGCLNGPRRICRAVRGVIEYVAWIFDPEYMFSTETLRFTVMNLLPILITYAVTLYSDGSVFVQYSATMPMTLSLLVTYDYGATAFKNVQRLMGVTFGHTVPLLLMSVIELFDCAHYARFTLHAAAIFFYYIVFAFMYYASSLWSTIGCLIAGFGCWTLFRPCDLELQKDYAALFKDIAEVIVAILLKMAVSSVLSRKAPRDLAVKSLKEAFMEIRCAMDALFDDDRISGESELEMRCNAADAALDACKALEPLCDPSLDLYPGIRTKFKLRLYSETLEHMRLVLADVGLLRLALHGHENENEAKNKITSRDSPRLLRKGGSILDGNVFDHMRTMKSWSVIRQDVIDTLTHSFGACAAVLEHSNEKTLTNKHIKALRQMCNFEALDGVAEFYEEMSNAVQDYRQDLESSDQDSLIVTQLHQTRIAVATHSLALLTQHSAYIATNCFQHMVYGSSNMKGKAGLLQALSSMRSGKFDRTFVSPGGF